MAEVLTKKHRWMEMTYVPISIAGYHEDGRPSVFPLGDPIVGISCFDCAEPLTKEAEQAECSGNPS